MEWSPRGFMQLRVEACGAQSSATRFSAETQLPPRSAFDRVNLTALSQYRNLFFVACLDQVLVYEPKFPSQSLEPQPALTIRLPVSRPGLSYHIDRNYPHAVNHLLVDDLGDEEILACACDDGDVLLYHVTSIAGLVLSRPGSSPANSVGSAGAENAALRPFFHENVGKSAWGMAMHKTARMFAVSNNSTIIDVIAFALRQDTDDSSSETPDEETPPGSPARPITQNHHVRLAGHQANVPSVAFCNNAFDPDGLWLVSTDVLGVLIVWDIWNTSIIRRCHLGHANANPNAWYPSSTEHRCGWGVLCLDKAAFRRTAGALETYGLDRPSDYGFGADISRSHLDVVNCSRVFNSPPPGAEGSEELGVQLFSGDDGTVTEVMTTAEEATAGARETELIHQIELLTHLGFNTVAASQSAPSESGDEGSSVSGEESAGNDDSDGGQEGESQGSASHGRTVDTSLNMEPDLASAEPVRRYGLEESPILSVPNAGHVQQQNNAAGSRSVSHPITYSLPQRARSRTSGLGGAASGSELAQPHENVPSAQPIPRFFILHTTETIVRLLSAPSADPLVICRQPLHQNYDPQIRYLKGYERMNMVLSVPELSLAIVASQAGRVALLTLTRRDGHDPAFRIEHILPYESQELEGQRPVNPLLGVAVGPVQGREKVSESAGLVSSSTMRNRLQLWRKYERLRRYRLMLMYSDHSVLSYELARTSPTAANSD